MTTKNPWIKIGRAAEGGSVFVLATTSPSGPPATLWAGTSAGLFKSTDGGTSWGGAAKDLPFLPLQALALCSDVVPALVLAAGPSATVFRSADGGDSWERESLPSTVASVTCMAATSDGSVALAATLGGGVCLSRDYGRNWASANFGLLSWDIYSLALSPNWLDDETAFIVADDGVYRTDNGARSWKYCEGPLEDLACATVAVSPCGEDRYIVWVGTEDGGLWRSQDGGISWEQSALPAAAIVGLLPVSSGALLVSTAEQGLFYSPGGGPSWSCVGPVMAPLLTVVELGGTLFGGTYLDGLYASQDGGRHWQPRVRDFPGFAVADLCLAEGLLVLSGPETGLMTSRDGGAHWEAVETVPMAGQVGLLASTGERLWAWTNEGLYHATAKAQEWKPCAPVPGGGSATSIVCSPRFASDHLIWLAMRDGRLFRGEGGGRRWRPLARPTRDPLADLVLAVASEDGKVLLYCGALGQQEGRPCARLFRSRDGGLRWQEIGSWTTGVGRLVLAVTEQQGCSVALGDRLFVADASGRWRASTLPTAGGLALDLACTRHGESDAIWLATTSSLLASRDGGANWCTELYDIPIVRLALSQGALYALAVGGDIYRYDL